MGTHPPGPREHAPRCLIIEEQRRGKQQTHHTECSSKMSASTCRVNLDHIPRLALLKEGVTNAAHSQGCFETLSETCLFQIVNIDIYSCPQFCTKLDALLEAGCLCARDFRHHSTKPFRNKIEDSVAKIA